MKFKVKEKKFEGVVFDFNGVLLFDSKLQEDSWMAFSEIVRGKAFTKEEISMHVNGRSTKYVMEYLTGVKVSNAELGQLVIQVDEIYRKNCLANPSEFKLSSGAIEFLDFLKEKRIAMTIASSCGRENMQFFFQYLNLGKWFSIEKVVYDKSDEPRKEDYQKAAKNIGVISSHCMVVEDLKDGIKAAHLAGIGIIIAVGPRSEHQELLQMSTVKQAIESFEELKYGQLF